MSEAPVPSRINKRPAPGQPGANVENSRRKITSDEGYVIRECTESLKWTERDTPFEVVRALEKVITRIK